MQLEEPSSWWYSCPLRSSRGVPCCNEHASICRVQASAPHFSPTTLDLYSLFREAGPSSGNGFFTAALLSHLRLDGHATDVRMLMGAVRDTVVKTVRETLGETQEPWLHATLPGRHVFALPRPLSVGDTVTDTGQSWALRRISECAKRPREAFCTLALEGSFSLLLEG
jgi:hypothetical protein